MNSPVNPQLRRAKDLIFRDYAKPLDISDISKAAHMSQAHFARQFKKLYGFTPHKYLIVTRIERSMYLLRDGATVTEACNTVGFASLSSFSGLFKRITGLTPSEYMSLEHVEIDSFPACLRQIADQGVILRNFVDVSAR